jgi:hypothetical protein
VPIDDTTDPMNDDLPASALGMWVEGHSTSLSLNLELSGPFDAAGQDPEWMLRLEGENRASELLLFRGGLVMVHSFDKTDPAAEWTLMRRPLSAGALAVPAPLPAAGPTLAFLQFLLGPANAAFSGHLLLGILDPADELVAGQRRDVLPSIECRGVGDERLEQVRGKLVHHPTGHSVAAHRGRVAVQG